jgi:enoyl-CoA hydratase/3-hydroxyacyl-CoA dehydrogenase
MMASNSGPTTTLEIDPSGVGVITLHNPPVNALHPDVLSSLFRQLQSLQSNPDVKGIVVTGSNKTFCAGFDINQFQSSSNGGIDNDTLNAAFVNLLEDGPKPSVAAVDGVALGGGCEVALACNSRVSTDKASMGLPELQLGIIPGFGGTQRLPRVVGVAKGAEMMLKSQSVRGGGKLLSIGLVDAVVERPALLPAAKKMALDIAEGRLPRNKTLFRTDKVEAFDQTVAILDFARQQAAKVGLQHPLLCLDAIQHGLEHGGLAGLKKEGECFAKASSLDTHKALVHIFFAQRATKKVSGVTDRGLRPRKVSSIAVLGGGLMGSGIATACVLAGHHVIIKEINVKFMQDGLDRVKSNIMSRVKKGKMKKEVAEKALSLLKGTTTYEGFEKVDMVIEAVIENIDLKQKIFADLVRVCSQSAILSTNTSTIDIELIGSKVPQAQDRIVGAHFFSPAQVMPLLEIVRTSKTSSQVVLDTIAFGSTIKKTPVVVGNCTGFAVNRVFFPYTQAACLLVDMGLDPYMIDKVISGFGMPIGPFRLSDLVGADIGLHVGKNFLESFPERCYPARMILLLNEKRRLGEKTGSGFYKFAAGRKAMEDPSLREILQESREGAGLIHDVGKQFAKMSPKDIVEFIMFPVVNEGCRVISERIVDKPADLDIASVMSMGFPAPRGGLIFWADLCGAAHISNRLQTWADALRAKGLAGFFEPCEYLKMCAQQGRKLEAGVDPASRL